MRIAQRRSLPEMKTQLSIKLSTEAANDATRVFQPERLKIMRWDEGEKCSKTDQNNAYSFLIWVMKNMWVDYFPFPKKSSSKIYLGLLDK